MFAPARNRRGPVTAERIMSESPAAEIPATMLRTAEGPETHSPPKAARTKSAKGRKRAPRTQTAAYDRHFWFSYAANFFMVAAVSLLFRYSDFVEHLGGNEQHLGWIVGVGMIGSLSMRVFQGTGIDRYGPRLVWTLSLAGFIASCVAQHFLTRVDGPAIYFWRMVLQTSVAGVYGASIAYVSARAPIERLAEVVGTLGTSGFLGMQFGTVLSDVLAQQAPLGAMFHGAALLGAGSLVCALLGAGNAVRHSQHRRLPTFQVLRKYHPGPLLLVAIVMGFGLSLPTVFVRPFAASLGVGAISWFFVVYTGTAFGTRLAIRHAIDRRGTRTIALVGLTCLIAGIACFIPISAAWHFMLPAFLMGAAHAMLFPAATAGVSRAFPPRYRGLATTLNMTMFDFGAFVGAPLCGALLGFTEARGWSAYPMTFAIVVFLLTLCAVTYALASAPRPVGPRRSVDRIAELATIEPGLDSRGAMNAASEAALQARWHDAADRRL